MSSKQRSARQEFFAFALVTEPPSSAGTPHTAPRQLLSPHSAIRPWSPSVYGSAHPLPAPPLSAIRTPRCPPAVRRARTSPLPKGLSLSPPRAQHRTQTFESRSASVGSTKSPAPSRSQSANAAPPPPMPASPSAQTGSRFRFVPSPWLRRPLRQTPRQSAQSFPHYPDPAHPPAAPAAARIHLVASRVIDAAPAGRPPPADAPCPLSHQTTGPLFAAPETGFPVCRPAPPAFPYAARRSR